MSNSNTEKKSEIKNNAVNRRRFMQYQAMLEWDRGFTTPHECIEKILELEKVLFLNNDLLKKDNTENSNGGQVHK